MSFQEKNIAVSLGSFSLILVIFIIRVLQLILTDNFTETNVFRLWGIVIVIAIVVTILATILTHILSAIFSAIDHYIKTGDENPDIEDIDHISDERDKLIDLKGTRVTYTVSSIGVFLAMLTFVFGQLPLVMFTLLIFFGVLAQVIGDISRLLLYRRGF
jgi:hypothetical protein